MQTVKELVYDWLLSNECDGLTLPDAECSCCLTDIIYCDGTAEIFDCFASRREQRYLEPIQPAITVGMIVVGGIKAEGCTGLEHEATECGCTLGDDDWLACNGDADITDCRVRQ